jgi:hypothetical protein
MYLDSAGWTEAGKIHMLPIAGVAGAEPLSQVAVSMPHTQQTKTCSWAPETWVSVQLSQCNYA